MEGDSPKETDEVVDTQPPTVTEPAEEKSILDSHPYLKEGFKYPEGWQHEPPLVAKPEETDSTTVEPIVEQAVTEEQLKVKEDEEQQIVDSVEENEKAAMARWKSEHPGNSLKLQRQLLEKGIIKELPWTEYLRAQADYEDDSKKKDSELDGEGRLSSSEENTREVIYKQNAEQNNSTIWQRLKTRFNDGKNNSNN